MYSLHCKSVEVWKYFKLAERRNEDSSRGTSCIACACAVRQAGVRGVRAMSAPG